MPNNICAAPKESNIHQWRRKYGLFDATQLGVTRGSALEVLQKANERIQAFGSLHIDPKPDFLSPMYSRSMAATDE